MVRSGGGEAFYSPMIRCQSFSEPVVLDCDLDKMLFNPPHLRKTGRLRNGARVG